MTTTRKNAPRAGGAKGRGTNDARRSSRPDSHSGSSKEARQEAGPKAPRSGEAQSGSRSGGKPAPKGMQHPKPQARRPAPAKSAAAPTAASDTSPDAPLRINKALAQAGICSRRRADELVAAGRVRVNGAVVDSAGFKVVPATDRIEVDGKPVNLLAALEADHLYIMLHKPVHTVTTAHDPEGRTTIFDLLPESFKKRRPVNAGRLDYFSEGLILLSTDGELVHRLTHPSHHQAKVYHCHVRGQVADSALAAMRKGMTLAEGEKLAPVQASIINEDGGGTWIELTLHQGVNRQIRRMCRDLELTVLRLVRVATGPLRLGGLASGAWRELTPAEIRALRTSVGIG